MLGILGVYDDANREIRVGPRNFYVIRAVLIDVWLASKRLYRKQSSLELLSRFVNNVLTCTRAEVVRRETTLIYLRLRSADGYPSGWVIMCQ